jgi:hypothetical protein
VDKVEGKGEEINEMFISNDDFIALSGSWNVTKCKGEV